jgi:hypothetical protein
MLATPPLYVPTVGKLLVTRGRRRRVDRGDRIEQAAEAGVACDAKPLKAPR